MIATNYILKQSMVDMVRFTDKEYYDNMVILTAYILKKQLTSLDLGMLKHRVMNGEQNGDLTNNEPLYISSANRLKEITLNNEKKKEKALLLVSKFYIKIMTVFSAITATIDPQYVFEDENGEKQFFFLKDYDDYRQLNPDTKKLKVSQLDNPIGFIKKRLAILKNKMHPANNNNTNNNGLMVLNPGEKLCELSNHSIYDEIGIKELDVLYYDVYDYEENKWTKRSNQMQKKYEEDLLIFYQIFTGNKDKPDHVKKFADIETLDFNKLKRCINRDFFEDLMISKDDHLFVHYMDKIDKIQSITKVYKQKLLFILKQIFVKSAGNSETGFAISSQLNMESLLNYQDEVKKIINQIYMNCERLFIEALVIYEKMYDKQNGELTENKIRNINESIKQGEMNVLDETSLIPPANYSVVETNKNDEILPSTSSKDSSQMNFLPQYSEIDSPQGISIPVSIQSSSIVETPVIAPSPQPPVAEPVASLETPIIDSSPVAPVETPIIDSSPVAEPVAPVETPIIDSSPVAEPVAAVETPMVDSSPVAEPVATVETPIVYSSPVATVETPMVDSSPVAEPVATVETPIIVPSPSTDLPVATVETPIVDSSPVAEPVATVETPQSPQPATEQMGVDSFGAPIMTPSPQPLEKAPFEIPTNNTSSANDLSLLPVNSTPQESPVSVLNPINVNTMNPNKLKVMSENTNRDENPKQEGSILDGFARMFGSGS
jgi:hypothetical protein